jgi:hypothetical protein
MPLRHQIERGHYDERGPLLPGDREGSYEGLASSSWQHDDRTA